MTIAASNSCPEIHEDNMTFFVQSIVDKLPISDGRLKETRVVSNTIGSNSSNENNVRNELPYKSRLRQNTRKPEIYGY